MKNAMQLKSTIKKISKEKGISAQLIMQNYMLERLLERISISKYQPNFILKGGFLIASIVGLDTRATMDMDATIKGLPVTEEHLLAMFTDICNIEIDDNVTFTFKSISSIRAKDEYSGYRISLTANYPPMSVPLKLDITTGDKITPREITYDFKLLLEDRTIQILSYNLETVMSEKIETVITRGDQNTRPRDFYDIYILYKLQGKNIDYSTLRKALQETARKRHSEEIIKDHKEIISVIKNSDIMNKRWKDYQKDFSYAQNIEFQSTLLTLIEIMNII